MTALLRCDSCGKDVDPKDLSGGGHVVTFDAHANDASCRAGDCANCPVQEQELCGPVVEVQEDEKPAARKQAVPFGTHAYNVIRICESCAGYIDGEKQCDSCIGAPCECDHFHDAQRSGDTVFSTRFRFVARVVEEARADAGLRLPDSLRGLPELNAREGIYLAGAPPALAQANREGGVRRGLRVPRHPDDQERQASSVPGCDQSGT